MELPAQVIVEGGLLFGIVRTTDLGYCLLNGIARKIDLEGDLLIGIVRTIYFGDGLLIGTVWTIRFGDCPLIGIFRTLVTEIACKLELSGQLTSGTFNQYNMSGQLYQVGVY